MTTRRLSDSKAAWWSLALVPVAFVAAFVVGEGLATLLGHPSGSSEPAPGWVALAVGVPALLVMALPALAAVHFGRRAVRSGDSAARTPMWIAVGVIGVFGLLNLVSYTLMLVFG